MILLVGDLAVVFEALNLVTLVCFHLPCRVYSVHRMGFVVEVAARGTACEVAVVKAGSLSYLVLASFHAHAAAAKNHLICRSCAEDVYRIPFDPCILCNPSCLVEVLPGNAHRDIVHLADTDHPDYGGPMYLQEALACRPWDRDHFCTFDSHFWDPLGRHEGVEHRIRRAVTDVLADVDDNLSA